MKKNFREECRKVITSMRSMILHGPPHKIEVVKKTFPLLGGFISWFKENYRKSHKTIEEKILELSEQSFEFEVTPEIQDEIRMANCIVEGIPCKSNL